MKEDEEETGIQSVYKLKVTEVLQQKETVIYSSKCSAGC